MELNKKEEALIKAIREMDTPVYNVLLWYTAGLQSSLDKIANAGITDDPHKYEFERNIKIARSYMKEM